MERLELLEKIKEQLMEINSQSVYFGNEQLPGAALDYHRLFPEYIEHLKDCLRWDASFFNQDYQFFLALNNLSNYSILLGTLACAAGAEGSFCRQWYSLTAKL